MTSGPGRLTYAAILAAFLAGVAVVAGVSLALGGNEREAARGVQAPGATIRPTATPEPMATVMPTAEPSPVPPEPTPGSNPQAAPAPPVIQPTAPPANNSAVRQPAAPGNGYAFIGAVWADESIPVPYCVNPANPPVDSNGAPIMSQEAFAAAVRRAFQAWQDVPGSYIAFRYTGLCDSDPFNFRDQVNTVGWGWLFSSAVGLAGPGATHGKFQRQSSLGQLYEMDIVVDVRYAQSFDDEALYINRALPYVLLHETGHFIGLDHSGDPCSIMKSVVSDDAAALCVVDANGARALYPQ